MRFNPTTFFSLRLGSRRGVRLTAYGFLALLFFAVRVPAWAQGEGLDLLVLIDQSGSMRSGGAKTNDPTRRRFRLLDLAVSQLAESADYDRLRHRLAVVSFGSTVRLDVPWSDVRRSELEDLGRLLDSISVAPGLGDTNFLAAFEAVRQQFAMLPSVPQRRRAVLLLSDGILDQPGLTTKSHLRGLKRTVADAIRETDASLEVAILCPAGCDGWERFGDLWLSLPGIRVRLFPEEEDRALVELFGLVREWVSTQAVSAQPLVAGGVEESIVLPPYLDTVAFDFFGTGSAGAVVAFPPDRPARALRADDPDVEERWLGSAVRTLTVHRPAPGRWVFRKPSPEAKIEIFSRQFFARGFLVSPGQGSPPLPHQRAEIRYRLRDGQAAFQPLAAYPVTLELAVLRPDGYRRHFQMEEALDPEPALYRSTRQPLFDLPGHYRTEVKMMTHTLDGWPVTVFEDRWSGFTVRQEIRKIACELTSPASGTRLPRFGTFLFQRRPLAVHLACRRQSQPANLGEAEAAALVAAIRPRLDLDDQPAETSLRLASISEDGLVAHVQGAQAASVYSLALEVDSIALPHPVDLELVAPRRSFTRGLTWSHRGQVALLGLALIAFSAILLASLRRLRFSRSGRPKRRAAQPLSSQTRVI